MIRRLLIPSVMLLSAAIASAQQERPRGNPIEIVARFLDLSQAQVDQLKDLIEKRKAETAPIRENLREQSRSLRELMKSPAPNPTAVGESYIKIRDLRQQLREGQDAFMDSFEKILSEDQKAKLKAVQRGNRLAPFLRAFRRLWLI